MATKYIVQHRAGTEDRLNSTSKTIFDRELIVERSNDGKIRLKVGDGETAYVDLPYVSPSIFETVNGLSYDGTYLYLTANGVVVSDPVEIKGGGSDEGLNDRVAELEEQMADLLYKDIKIESFKHDLGTNVFEIGSKITSFNFSWQLNRKPVSLTLGNKNLPLSASGQTPYDGSEITTTTTWTLEAKGEKGEISRSTAGVSFYNGVYYGKAIEPQSYDSSFVQSLTKKLSGQKVESFIETTGANEYMYYCLPTRMGTCIFNVGGFDGGFSLVDTIEFENKSNYTETYYIYRSSNPNLGTKTVKIS